jgi:hypothetical protein
VAAAGLVFAGLTACTPAPATPVASQHWERLDLPADFVASQLVVVDGELVVAGSTNGESPALLRARDGGGFDSIPVEPVSFYGAVARWYSVIADGSEIRALGGRTGGGHGNPRWSTWRGDRQHLAEQPPPGMEVFGGWRAGGMVGVAVAGGQPVLVGGRAGEEPGLDIAVWLAQGADWVEQPSAGTPLAAAPGVLPFATSVTANGDGLLITGFTQRSVDGRVRVEAQLWSGSPAGSWDRVDLAADSDAESSAESASCDAGGCLIAGRGDGELRVWSFDADHATAFPVPSVAVGDAGIPAPVFWRGRATLIAPDEDGSALLVGGAAGDLGTWELSAGPAGRPVALASSGDTLYVLVAPEGGAVELWSTT